MTMDTLFKLLCYITFIGAGVTLIGVALYYLDNWLDKDEAENNTAKHRA